MLVKDQLMLRLAILYPYTVTRIIMGIFLNKIWTHNIRRAEVTPNHSSLCSHLEHLV